MKNLSRTTKKLIGLQPSTPTGTTAAIPTLRREDSPATKGPCVAATQLPTLNLVDQSAAPVDIDVADVTKCDDHGLDQLISAKVANIRNHNNKVRGHREAEKTGWRDLLPMLDEMQRRLTRRGARFGETYTSYLTGKDLNDSTVRSWRRRLKLESPTTAKSVESDKESPDTPSNCDWQDEREEIQTSAELAQRWANKLREVLTGPSTMSDSMRIKRADAMVADFQRALSEGKLFPAIPASEPPITVSPARVAAEPSAPITPCFQPTIDANAPHPATQTPPNLYSTSVKPTRDEAEPSAPPTTAFQPTTRANAPHRATQTVPRPRSKSVKPVKGTSCAPVTDAEGEDRGNRVLPDAIDFVPSAITRAGFARAESGRWEFVGLPDNEPIETNAVDGDNRGNGRV
jgi:hypothetical protein